MKENAFVLVHFGDKPKYLELEIYLCLNLRKNTYFDIVYLYSINDTPNEYLKIMEKYCDTIIPYDDNGITYNVTFSSVYTHFNILRTCNFIFAYSLTQYKKICLLESDMIIRGNIDDIFKLKTPSMLVYHGNILENHKLINNQIDFLKLNTNGGIMVIKPSLNKLKEYKKNIKHVIEVNYKYPNEILFLLTNKFFYNVPYKYNSHAAEYELVDMAKKYDIDMRNYPLILHFKCNIYKHIDTIKDEYLESMKNKKPLLYAFIKEYKKDFYDKNYKKINKIINSL
jgi:alpha-N-acetylglucosamine transferase